MLVGRVVPVSACARWCWQVELPIELELELAPLRVRGLAHTALSLAPGVASCPPGGLGMGADDLPTTSWRQMAAHLVITLLAMRGAI
jgi:hypothetical protein